MLYSIGSYDKLSSMFSDFLGRPATVVWRLFRHLVRYASPGRRWCFNPQIEIVEYKTSPCSFEEFATLMFHEATHGVCELLSPNEEERYKLFARSVEEDEEHFCWQVSKTVCERLGIEYQEAVAARCHHFHLSVKNGDYHEVTRLVREIGAGGF